MRILLHRFGGGVEVAAGDAGLEVSSSGGAVNLAARESWPADALSAPGGWRTALELEQLTELGLAEASGIAIVVPYTNFREIEDQIPVSLVHAWSEPSPFLLQIDRKGDIGHPDFLYRYQLLLAGQPVYGDRAGYYFKRAGAGTVFRLDHQMFSLLEAMDRFNELPPERKTAHSSWLSFAKIKGCANEVGAILDQVLQKNDVVVPSVIGLDIHNNLDGTLSFLPKSEGLATAEFQQAFVRNSEAQNVYSIDPPGRGRLRVVLSDQQQEVLRRMKRIRHVRGDVKERVSANPEQVFDGVLDSVELPDPTSDYGDRVFGIGAFDFAPIPRQPSEDLSMAALWKDGVGPGARETTGTGTDSKLTERGDEGSGRSATEAEAPAPPDSPASQGDKDSGSSEGPPGNTPGPSTEADPVGVGPKSKMFLLIDTNEEFVKDFYLEQARLAAGAAPQAAPFQRPAALLSGTELKPHQEQGVQWMQTCISTPDRKGILLADDMGLGKTLQILTFLAWCIESGRFPDLACSVPPFRPILLVVPLILLENRTWENEMERFFENRGSLFWPVEHLHGSRIAHYRRADMDGPEAEAMRPALDLDRVRKNRVVITNYETLKNFQYSFAYCPGGQSIWSAIVSDEAQEFKIPSTRISHAMKSLKATFQIACTGTPVENRLLDLWNLYDVVQPGLLSSAREFVGQFESRLRGEDRAEVFGELKRRLLFQQPHAFLLRREKKDVASLPPKTPKPLMCAMSATEIDLHQRLLGELRTGSGAARHLSALQRFAQLYQHPALLTGGSEDAPAESLIAQSSKLKRVIEALHEIRAKREKAIIFSRHHTMQAILAKVLESEFGIPVKTINGLTKSGGTVRGGGTRASILRSFQETKGFHMLILSPFVAGIGLTITEANHVIHYGRWWNPAVEAQATDRAYRIGQTKEVFVYLPILYDPSGRVAPSFDQRLDTLLAQKYRDAEDFLCPLPGEDSLGSELFEGLSK